MIIKTKEQQSLDKLKKTLLPVLKRHHVLRAGIFGSTAAGTAREASDLDVLVEFKGKKNLLDLVALKLELEETTNRDVDVLTYQSLNRLIKRKVLAREVRIV